MKKITKCLIGFLACIITFCMAGCYPGAIKPNSSGQSSQESSENSSSVPSSESSSTQSSEETASIEERDIVVVDDETDIARFAMTPRSGITPTISYKANYKGASGVAEIISKNAKNTTTGEVKKYGGFIFLALKEAEALEIYNQYKADPANFTLKINLYVRVADTENIVDTKATLSGVFNNVRDFQMNRWQEFSIAGADIVKWTSAEQAVNTLTGKVEFLYIQHAWESATISNTNVESDIYIYVDSIKYTVLVDA